MNNNDESANQKSSKINVYSSLVYVGIISSIMLFAGLSSAVLVRKMDKFWVNIHLPNYFLFSTLIIAMSSITLYFAFNAAKKGKLKRLKSLLLCTLFLGFSFSFAFFGFNSSSSSNSSSGSALLNKSYFV